MDPNLPPVALDTYSSLSQRARVRTEAWAARELYCFDCDSERLESLPVNTVVADYECPGCEANGEMNLPKVDAKILKGSNKEARFFSSHFSIGRAGVLVLHEDRIAKSRRGEGGGSSTAA